jgi:hypothetical protein
MTVVDKNRNVSKMGSRFIYLPKNNDIYPLLRKRNETTKDFREIFEPQNKKSSQIACKNKKSLPIARKALQKSFSLDLFNKFQQSILLPISFALLRAQEAILDW